MAESRKTQYRKYLKSEAWYVRRSVVLKRDRNKCQDCGGDAQDVHHLTYERIFEELPEDLVSLCRPCHQIRHDIHPNKRNRKPKPPKKPKKAKKFAKAKKSKHFDSNAEVYRERLAARKVGSKASRAAARKVNVFHCPMCKTKTRRAKQMARHVRKSHTESRYMRSPLIEDKTIGPKRREAAARADYESMVGF